jgi:arylsulfatase A-like enzyme
MDTVNTQYAIEEMIGHPEARVLFVWFPMVDKTSHFSPRGQFGAARRDLVIADRYFGQLLRRLEEVGWRDNTYIMLISDHGHMGGKTAVNQAANLASEWAFRKLGVNVRIIGHTWQHPGLDKDQFFFFDHQGWGQAKIFMPHADYLNGDWKRNRLYEVQNYRVRPGTQPIDLIASLHQYQASRAVPMRKPVDLVLVKLDAARFLISRSLNNQAIVTREADADGREAYRYEPLKNVRMAPDGSLSYEPAEPSTDPLSYLSDPQFMVPATERAVWLQASHSAEEWLWASHRSRYPDAVVAMSKFFSWQGRLQELADVRDPDILITAAEGWSFREDNLQGTDHGYPLADSMRMSLFVHGPNVPTGRNELPARMVDVVPTALDMVDRYTGYEGFDGKPLQGLYE